MTEDLNTEPEAVFPVKRSKWKIAGYILLGIVIVLVLGFAAYGADCYFHFHWGDGLMPSNSYKPENLVHIFINTDGGREFDIQYLPETVIVSKTPDGENYMYIWLKE